MAVASATATASTDAGTAPAPDDNPWCERGEASLGTWTATPDDLLAAARKLESGCAPPTWFVQAVGDCMQRLGQSNVNVNLVAEPDSLLAASHAPATLRSCRRLARVVAVAVT